MDLSAIVAALETQAEHLATVAEQLTAIRELLQHIVEPGTSPDTGHVRVEVYGTTEIGGSIIAYPTH